IGLQAEVSAPTENVTWYVNGVQYAKGGPPYQARWRLERGRHRIAAVAGDSFGDEILVTVE
ncbi:MAG TPA: hypothetical protein PKH07_02845, partial [bacterium]|nr:hypothetical protein [bacterium]